MTRVVRSNGVIELHADNNMMLYSEGIVTDYVLVGLHGDETMWEEITSEAAEAKKEEYEIMNEDLDDADVFEILTGGAE